MKILLSPAKKLDFQPPPTAIKTHAKPLFAKDTAELIAELKKLSQEQWQDLMGLSPNLASLNFSRVQNWEVAEEKVAILAFSGDVYQGLDASSLDKDALLRLDKGVWILSGLYGALRPLDAIRPYRLEMGCSLNTRRGKNLYEFWGERIAKVIEKMADKDEPIINLSSNEYFQAVKALKNLGTNRKIFTPVFLEKKQGSPAKVIGLLAKRARGMMTRFIVENNIQNPDELHGFNSSGYRFTCSEDEANQNHTFIYFQRELAIA